MSAEQEDPDRVLRDALESCEKAFHCVVAEPSKRGGTLELGVLFVYSDRKEMNEIEAALSGEIVSTFCRAGRLLKKDDKFGYVIIIGGDPAIDSTCEELALRASKDLLDDARRLRDAHCFDAALRACGDVETVKARNHCEDREWARCRSAKASK